MPHAGRRPWQFAQHHPGEQRVVHLAGPPMHRLPSSVGRDTSPHSVKPKQRGSDSWIAYQRGTGRGHKKHQGKSSELTGHNEDERLIPHGSSLHFAHRLCSLCHQLNPFFATCKAGAYRTRSMPLPVRLIVRFVDWRDLRGPNFLA